MKNDQWQKKVQQHLDDDLEQLDQETLQRLQQARFQALDAVKQSAWRTDWSVGVAFASVAVIAVAVWLTVPDPQLNTPSFDDMALMVDSQTLEFYEDVDFYYWLAMDEVDDVTG